MNVAHANTLNDDIKQIIADTLKVNPDILQDSTRLIEEGLSLGSLQLIELVVAIEKRFDVAMEGELMQIENFATVRTLSDAVGRALG